MKEQKNNGMKNAEEKKDEQQGRDQGAQVVVTFPSPFASLHVCSTHSFNVATLPPSNKMRSELPF